MLTLNALHKSVCQGPYTVTVNGNNVNVSLLHYDGIMLIML